MSNSEHMDLLNSTSESISDMKKKLKNIEMTLDIYCLNNPNNLKNVLREIIFRRYKIYKNELKLLY
jgi:hypothetical protein